MDPANDTVRIKNKLNASTRKTYGHFSWLWRPLGNSVENPVEPGKEFATKTRYNEVVKLVKNQSDRFADVERMELHEFWNVTRPPMPTRAFRRSDYQNTVPSPSRDRSGSHEHFSRIAVYPRWLIPTLRIVYVIRACSEFFRVYP